jgi:hypothetical protein
MTFWAQFEESMSLVAGGYLVKYAVTGRNSKRYEELVGLSRHLGTMTNHSPSRALLFESTSMAFE